MGLYRILLRLCPHAMRREYGAAMEETFARRVADARRLGWSPRAYVWSRELAGVVALAFTERWWNAVQARQQRRYASTRKVGRMDALRQEIRLAARRLMRSPGFTAASVMTLALAIGANAAIFAIVQRVVLNPLPYPDSDRLIEVDHGSVGLRVTSGLGTTAGMYFHYSERSRSLDSVAVYRSQDLTLTGAGTPERVRVTRATPSLATVMRVGPALGRWFTHAEGEPGAPLVAVLSHALWMRRFDHDPNIVGRSITLDGVSRAVVGIMPATYGFASVGLVLLVACANVANLFLVRSEGRQRDIAVRRALGAGTLRIARYFFAESGLLSIGGGIVGLALAWTAVRLLVAFAPQTLPRLEEIRLDRDTVVFVLMLSVAVAAAFGAIPLWRGGTLARSLNDGGRSSTSSRTRHHVRHVLMGMQIALALVLLVASALMVRSFQNLRSLDPGFDATSAVTFNIGLPAGDYPSLDAAIAAHHAIIDRLSALPAVRSVSATTCLPLAGGCSGNTMRIEGRVYSENATPPIALFRGVAGNYFETMGMHLLRGRGIDRGDVARREPVAVINESIASHYFTNEDPIGQHVASNLPPSGPGEEPRLKWLMVVGVVANTPTRALGEATQLPQLYIPMSLGVGPGMPPNAIGPNAAAMSYIVRSAIDPLELLPSLRREIDTIDRNLAMAQVKTLQDTLDRAAAQMAFTMTLIAIAGGVSLVLGVIGIYGAMSYIVALRTGEIGVRLALGADPGSVIRMIVRQGGLVALAGIGVGLATAYAGSRLLQSLLYDVSAHDPRVFATTAVVLLVVALLACWLPARRAARLSPVEALRAE